jgi:hypothetical protein
MKFEHTSLVATVAAVAGSAAIASPVPVVPTGVLYLYGQLSDWQLRTGKCIFQFHGSHRHNLGSNFHGGTKQSVLWR